MALAILAGCHGRTPAPAPSAAIAEEHLQRRLPATEPAPLPEQTAEIAETAPVPYVAEKPASDLQQPSSVNPRTFNIQEDRPGMPIPPEPNSSADEAASAKSDAPQTDDRTTEFSINEKDATGQQGASQTPAETASSPKQPEAPIAQLKEATAAPAPKETPAPRPAAAEIVKADPIPPAKPETKTEPTPATPDESAAASSPLPWGPSRPTPEMAAIAKRAEETARHGFDLAERGRCTPRGRASSKLYGRWLKPWMSSAARLLILGHWRRGYGRWKRWTTLCPAARTSKPI